MSQDSITPSVPTIILHGHISKWRTVAIMLRDHHERYLVLGNDIAARAADVAADGIEMCVSDIESLIRIAEGDEYSGETSSEETFL